ncbi:TetR/AcrR family transcriptional regulator [Nocardia sp. NBC_00508]|uniref:TetR/AcrR family transcriptional regulator n=1 Tax=Nocardia sp. NBC_00508 TaxID=2975992 RepID=UPI002E81BD10|nr:TetR/AcrR family transcriptional regulator [Nocardia sp. NBC_00508]WUD65715.1 TetR/AcrR family transcriptional regulator [Nocardia sp. NBC_00508]
MPRPTRAQSQAQTRAVLIGTAKRLFLDEGYQATSIDKVAKAAGFTKGAVYSNFRTKDELCLAVLDEIHGERAAEVADIIAAPTTADRLRRLAEWAEEVIGDPNWTQLEMEFSVRARRDDQLRGELATRLDAIVGMIGTALKTTDEVDTRVPTAEAAVAVLALGVGLGLFRSIDPGIPISGMISALRAIAGLSQDS